jgi:hypothetical protein
METKKSTRSSYETLLINYVYIYLGVGGGGGFLYPSLIKETSLRTYEYYSPV